MRKRGNYVDAAKGIAILLIASIHAEVFGRFGYPLAFIAVPTFFFMSGFYDRSERGVGKSGDRCSPQTRHHAQDDKSEQSFTH